MIVLTRSGHKCKCSNNHYVDNNQNDYWYNTRTGELYSEDPHTHKKPARAEGVFVFAASGKKYEYFKETKTKSV